MFTSYVSQLIRRFFTAGICYIKRGSKGEGLNICWKLIAPESLVNFERAFISVVLLNRFLHSYSRFNTCQKIFKVTVKKWKVKVVFFNNSYFYFPTIIHFFWIFFLLMSSYGQPFEPYLLSLLEVIVFFFVPYLT